MEIQELLALYDRQMRVEIEYPDMRKEVTHQVVRFVRPEPGMNFITYSWLEKGDMDRVILEQADFFRKQEGPFSWHVCVHDRPANLGERLETLGFEPDDPGAVMVLALDQAPDELLRPVKADVRRITSRAGLEDVILIEEGVWGGSFDWMRARMGAHLDIPGYLSVYVGTVEGQPAAVGWTYFHPGLDFAGLFGGSTLEQHRGRGLYTAILAARVQEARQRGRRFLVVDAGPMSRPIVARHGFQQITIIREYAASSALNAKAGT